MLKIVIAGRPNTGKSTLFNQLTGTRDALVHDRPGVTRDVVGGIMRVGDMDVLLSDTAGLENARGGIAAQSTDMALLAIKDADAVLFVVDGRSGLTAEDIEWAKRVRRAKKTNIILLANKAESAKRMADAAEFYKLGFGAPHPISAEHKIGFDAIYEFVEKLPTPHASRVTPHAQPVLQVAIMGQPNVGKSTLINKILGQNRVIVRDEPGVTRDTVKIKTKIMGRDAMLVDTAGLRRKAGVTDDVETLSALKSLDAIDKSDVVILVVDATKNIENQALGIAGRIYDAGKILIVALNKWDLVEEAERENKLMRLKRQFNNSFHQIIKPVILPISAEAGTGVKNLLKRAVELHDLSKTRAATSFINRVLEKLIAAHQPPMSRVGRRMKIKFAKQTKTNPATISISVGGASDLPESYTRYLRKGLAAALKWESLPVVIEYEKSENPYEE